MLVSWCLGYVALLVFRRIARNGPDLMRVIGFGAISALFFSPGLLPLAGAGHGSGWMIVPASVVVGAFGIELPVLAPYTATYSIIVCFVAGVCYSIYQHKHRDQRRKDA